MTDIAEVSKPDFEIGSDIFEVTPGQWYWVKDTQYKNGAHEDYTWFGCCIHVGSNYLEVQAPPTKTGSYSSKRIHFDDFWTKLTFEPEHERVLAEKVAEAQGHSRSLMEQIRELTSRLGLQSQTAKIGSTPAPDAGGNTLMVMSGTENLGGYKTDLIKAKEETLPELFKNLKGWNEQVARWMSADAMSLEVSLSPMKATIAEIEGRIFNISLYAGLTESAAMARDGEPADINEKLHVMQTRLYMDEECLMYYEAGGMEFDDVHGFDEWLARDENFHRLLPFPRCAVAFRVRRNEKERESGGTMLSAYINMQKAMDDKKTFLYVRNGDQLWWIETDINFGENLFPDQAVFDPLRPMMVRMDSFKRFEGQITLEDYADRVAAAEEAKIKHEAWVLENTLEDYKAEHGGNGWGYRSPYQSRDGRGWVVPGDSDFDPKSWQPMDPSHLYFDDYMAEKKAQIEQYNRIALIIQGLFDRSLCLHPHHPVRLWDHNSFGRSVELVYDGNATLYSGEKPDILAYFKGLNAQIDGNSIVMGQEVIWARREAERENEKRRRSWRNRGDKELTSYHPYGDPGPGYIGPMSEWKARSRKAIFRWERETQKYDRRIHDYAKAPCTISVDAELLFNVSAYKPGDFKQFFNDRRTRHEYLKWAPRLLAAEDYHAGKVRRSGQY